MSKTTVLILMLCAAIAAFSQNESDSSPAARPNPARDAALKELIPITTALREDDHPAVAARDGRVWVAWVSYSASDGSTRIYARSEENGKWSDPVEVSESAGDYYKPAIAIDEKSDVWVAWPAQVRGNWDIYCRVYHRGAWAKTERLTTDAGPDIEPQLAAAGSRVMLVWQSMRGNNLDILYRVHEAAWGPEGFVTRNPANDWHPALVATPDGAFHVAWDSYRGDYDVFLRSWKSGEWGAETPVAASAKLENHASLSADSRGRVWIAWEIGPEHWASDSAHGGLRAQRTIGIACLDQGKLYRVAANAPDAVPAAAAKKAKKAKAKDVMGTGMEEGPAGVLQSPAVWVGRDGKLRLFYRIAINKNLLRVETTVWEGSGWSQPEPVPNSEGRVDQKIVLAPLADKVFACFPAGTLHNVIYGKFYSSGMAGDGPTPPLTPISGLPTKPAPPTRARHTLNGYQLVWGDLHRHTDISEDGGIKDGSLTDTMRYALDAAPLDFIGVTDHTRYLVRRYNLWRGQQMADLYYKPGAFTPLHSYERSQMSPWGHRNVVNLDRNYEPVPASYDTGDPGVDPFGLYAALRGKHAMSIPHTSAWGTKQVSWDYADPDLERLVEIYQGCRSTYEYKGAPDPAGRAVYEEDSRSFVWDALARNIKLGFIASSDHGSTHMSFAAVYAKGLDRQSIFEALKARRTYAATDKILLDFSINDGLMGEEIRVAGKPELKVAVEGTTPIIQIDIIKSGKFVYEVRPGAVKAQFNFRDESYHGEETFYYVRVIQQDKNMAWASPIWVKPKM
jgi:hypothetical protein